MAHYSTEPRTRKHIKGYRFLSFAKNLSQKKLKKKILYTGIDSLKVLPKIYSIKQVNF